MTQPANASLDAVLQRAAFANLTDRAFLRVTGEDATRWLNGMVTNSAQALAPGEGNYNFLLNAQGRIQGDCFLYRLPSSIQAPEFLLATDAGQIQAITTHLDRFIIMDDVELTPAFADEASLLLVGAEIASTLRSLGLPNPDPAHLVEAASPHGPVLLLTPSPTAVPRCELRASTAVIAAIQHELEAAGVPEADANVLEQLRLLEATPRFSTDIRDRDLPGEANQPHALHFAKGCYLGQEIVERVRSRGQVHRMLTPLVLTGTSPTVPCLLQSGGKPAGEITSTAVVDLASGPALLALGYARREALDGGGPLTYEGGSARPRRAGQANS